MTTRTKETITKMYSPMNTREKRYIEFLVVLFIVLLLIAFFGIYNATTIFEDGSFILPNGWSGCLPWAICAVGG